MPKNNKKKTNRKRTGEGSARQLITADESEGSYYGTVTASLGSCRFRIKKLSDETEIQASIPGRMKKGRNRQRIAVGDMVIIELHECNSIREEYSIVYKYKPTEVTKLRKLGKLKVLTTEKETEAILFEDEVELKEDEKDLDEDFIAGI